MSRLTNRGFFLSLMGTAILLTAPVMAQEWLGVPGAIPRDRHGRARSYILQVRDASGIPIPGAVAMLSDIWIEQADSTGAVRFAAREAMRLPAVIKVTARGYEPRELLFDGSESMMEISLEKLETRNPAAGSSVSVAELAPETRDASERLQREAVEALLHGENNEAERMLLEAIQLTPSAGAAYNNLGVAVLRQRRLEDAVRWFENSYELRPMDSAAAGNLGLIRCVQGRRDDCYRLLDKATALGFEAPMAHYCLGVLALERANWKQGARELERVSPERFAYRDLYLTVALRGIGRQHEAARSFQSFLRRRPARLIWFTWPDASQP